MVERHLEPSRKFLDVRMVGDDAHNLARQLPRPPALQDLHQTMARLGGEQGNTRCVIRSANGEFSIRLLKEVVQSSSQSGVE